MKANKSAQKYKSFIFLVPQDLPKIVKEIILFLGLNISENDIQDICKKSSFSEMKHDTEKENSDPSHTVCALTSNRKLIFRKGECPGPGSALRKEQESSQRPQSRSFPGCSEASGQPWEAVTGAFGLKPS